MILVDFSSILHRKIHTAVANTNPTQIDDKLVTSEFIDLTKYFILQELFDISKMYTSKFGEMVICLDDASAGYWRKDVYVGYKSKRKEGRDESPINYPEVFNEIGLLIEQLKTNIPWKVVSVPRAEADDAMLVLADTYNASEKILIHSPDKDMIQAQRGNNTVKQYSSLTKKWLTGDTKSDDMQTWVQEHCILGDAGDGVPKVVEGTEFTKTFIEFLSEKGFDDIKTPMDFKAHATSDATKVSLIEDFNVYKTNRKGESTGVKDIYHSPRFGPSTLKKKIKEFGSVDNWLDSHPLYRPHYERNFTLVMQEGIPDYIREKILIAHKEAATDYNDREFTDYLNNSNLKTIVMELPTVFKLQRELNADDFGW